MITLTPRVQELADSCQATEETVARYAALGGAAWSKRAQDHLTGAEKQAFPSLAKPMILLLKVVGVRWIRSFRTAMVQADLTCSELEDEHRTLCRQRDGAAETLHGLLVHVRKQGRAHLDAKGVRLHLGMSGKTPPARTPEPLLRWSQDVVFALKNSEDEIPIDSRQFDLVPHLRRIERRQAELDAALNAVAGLKAALRVARRKRQQAVARCRHARLHCSRFVEAILGLAGYRHLTFEIRGMRPPGRPRMSDPASVSPPVPAPRGVKRVRGSFSWLANAVKRAAESFSLPLRRVKRGR